MTGKFTYGNHTLSYATTSDSLLATLTPPYEAYNQLVSYVSEANIPYMGVTTGHRTCRVSNALFVYINFINYNQIKFFNHEENFLILHDGPRGHVWLEQLFGRLRPRIH